MTQEAAQSVTRRNQSLTFGQDANEPLGRGLGWAGFLHGAPLSRCHDQSESHHLPEPLFGALRAASDGRARLCIEDHLAVEVQKCRMRSKRGVAWKDQASLRSNEPCGVLRKGGRA